jgi:hypothetical protein
MLPINCRIRTVVRLQRQYSSVSRGAEHTVAAKLSVSASGILLLRLTGDDLTQRSLRLTGYIAKRTMEWLAIDRGLPFQSPEVYENTLPQGQKPTRIHSETISFTTLAAPTLTHEDGKALESHMKVESTKVLLVYGMYSLAAEQQNPVAEFVFLYSLLEFIYGKQKSIDEWIWRVKAEEERVPNARYDRDGTRFTELRNDLGHPKRLDRSELDRLVPEVRNALPALRSLAKLAIKLLTE